MLALLEVVAEVAVFELDLDLAVALALLEGLEVAAAVPVAQLELVLAVPLVEPVAPKVSPFPSLRLPTLTRI